jgi:membrane-bound lytic murein transglycosylase D
MKPYRILAALMTALLITGNIAGAVPGQPRKDERTRLKLKEQNRRLQELVDSLQFELERCKSDLHYTDSIAGEMMAVYEENEHRSPAGLAPEDYTAEVSDSLLNIWYTHKIASDDESEVYDMDSVRFESNVPDEVYIERLKNMNSFISLPYNDIVKNYIILYSEKMPTKMAHMLGLCRYYMPIFEETFNKYEIPEELKAMAIIESALNPRAVSRVNAKGMWQFMYSTAKMYGLQIDSFVDERFDPVKSADAAARYLKDAYAIFGDWNLAIASYNCGAGNVNKAIRRSGGKRGFWDIWPYLPRETRGYGPAFVGALYTLTYYKEHGIKPEAVEIPLHIDTLKITRQLHMRQVSDLTNAPIDELKNLNPQYLHEIIPGGKEYILRIPYAYTNAFIENEDSVYKHKVDEYFNPAAIKKIKDGADGERITYKVKSGDTLGKIAGMYRCTVAQIKRWNNLKSTNIRIGQRLVIYRGGNSSASSSSSASTNKSQSSSSATTSGVSSYTVKSGDTLSSIAARHGVSVANLKSWNGLTSNNIKVGQKLKVKAADASQSSSAASSGDYTTYTVKSGDSFYSIAKNYPGVSAQNIMDFNGLSSSSLKPGMKIKIPKK